MTNLEKVQNYYNFKFTDIYGLQDFYIYEESTADGYSVFIATDDPEKILVNENVYYYDSDLKDALIEYIIYSSKLNEDVIYLDDLNAYFVQEAIEEINELIEDRND